MRRKFLWGSIWTIGGFGLSQVFRLIANIVLTRLLVPEIFGIMTIVNSLRAGFELLSDIGISQNIVQSRRGAEPDFYDTAWTIQLIRGTLLWIATIFTAPLVASFYGVPILGAVFPVIGLVFVIVGFSSTSVFLLQKQMAVAKRNAFDVLSDLVSVLAHITAASLNPTIWALVIGGIVATAARTIGSHFLIGGLKNRFLLSREHIGEILSFGKWILVASIVFFFAAHFDRLYFGKAFPLALLGVYGIARTLADAASSLGSRLTGLMVFPYVSNARNQLRSELRQKLTKARFGMIMLAAAGVAFVASSSDFIIQTLYDRRYWEGTWMLPLLCIGSWFAILSSLNEASLLGFGKPLYTALGNMAKLGFLVIGLPLAFEFHGAAGAIVVVMLSELVRYVPIYVGVHREQFGFGIQDFLATMTMLLMIGVFDAARWAFGFPKLTVGLLGLL